MTAHYVSQLDHRGSKSKRVFHSTGYLLPRSHQRKKNALCNTFIVEAAKMCFQREKEETPTGENKRRHK